ncbi:MAG: hypothetical protein ACE5R4_16005, partial [Armatimonadota bacterium]
GPITEGEVAQYPVGVSRVLVMWDSDNSWADFLGGIQDRDLRWYKAGNRQRTCWHTGNNNFLYADLHAKAGNWEQITWGQLRARHASGSRIEQPCLQPW